MKKLSTIFLTLLVFFQINIFASDCSLNLNDKQLYSTSSRVFLTDKVFEESNVNNVRNLNSNNFLFYKSLKNVLWKFTKLMVSFLAIQSNIEPVSASFTFHGQGKINDELSSYFMNDWKEFNNIVSNPHKKYVINNQYELELFPSKPSYVLFIHNENEEVYPQYSYDFLTKDLICCEAIYQECASTAIKTVKLTNETNFSMVKEYNDSSSFFTLVEIKFKPWIKDDYMCGRVKLVKFFFKIKKL